MKMFVSSVFQSSDQLEWKAYYADDSIVDCHEAFDADSGDDCVCGHKDEQYDGDHDCYSLHIRHVAFNEVSNIWKIYLVVDRGVSLDHSVERIPNRSRIFEETGYLRFH